MTSPKVSVVIPTYQRPHWIGRAVGSLDRQTRLPDEVVAVARDTDAATVDALAQLEVRPHPFRLRHILVSEPGFIPPVRAGLATATGDIIAVMDDDAEAEPDLLSRLVPHYADSSVGSVGGRCINYSEEGPTPVPQTDRVGYVDLFGRFIGKMYCEPTFTHPVDVAFLMGGNMSFRRDVAQRLEFDMELNRNVAQGYEVDIGLQVFRMGLRVLFDPLAAIRHYSAPRAAGGLRQPDADVVYWYAFNQTRVALRRLSPVRGSVALAFQFLVGDRQAPGLVPFTLAPLARKLRFEIDFAPAATRGRLMATKSVLQSART
ncbi:MAG: glycosyltransferase family 2 protein [Variovorax sp.]